MCHCIEARRHYWRRRGLHWVTHVKSSSDHPVKLSNWSDSAAAVVENGIPRFGRYNWHIVAGFRRILLAACDIVRIRFAISYVVSAAAYR